MISTRSIRLAIGVFCVFGLSACKEVTILGASFGMNQQLFGFSRPAELTQEEGEALRAKSPYEATRNPPQAEKPEAGSPLTYSGGQ
jgi:hypothetical protein